MRDDVGHVGGLLVFTGSWKFEDQRPRVEGRHQTRLARRLVRTVNAQVDPASARMVAGQDPAVGVQGQLGIGLPLRDRGQFELNTGRLEHRGNRAHTRGNAITPIRCPAYFGTSGNLDVKHACGERCAMTSRQQNGAKKHPPHPGDCSMPVWFSAGGSEFIAEARRSGENHSGRCRCEFKLPKQ